MLMNSLTLSWMESFGIKEPPMVPDSQAKDTLDRKQEQDVAPCKELCKNIAIFTRLFSKLV